MAAYTYTFTGDEITVELTANGQASVGSVGDREGYFDCQEWDRFGNREAGINVVTCTAHGSRGDAEPQGNVVTATFSVLGTPLMGVGFNTSNDVPTATFSLAFDQYIESERSCWVKWSKIGDMDFTIDASNEAGERPMDWPSYVYQIRRLGNKVVVYGKNGVTAMKPSGVHWGTDTIRHVGLMSKNSVTGTDDEHWFLDCHGYLFRLTSNGLEEMDYSEFLSSMQADTVMTYDPINRLVYLCDGTNGFVMSKDGLGKTFVDIAGYGVRDGTAQITKTSAVTEPTFEIQTDILNLGSMNSKVLYAVELGTDLSQALAISVDYRQSKSGSFTQSSWYTADSRGRVFPRVYGIEFRIRSRVQTYTYFEVDYIRLELEELAH